MKQTPTNFPDQTPFASALHLIPTVEMFSIMAVATQLPPSRLSTLEPRLMQMMQEDWRQSHAWLKLCLLVTVCLVNGVMAYLCCVYNQLSIMAMLLFMGRVKHGEKDQCPGFMVKETQHINTTQIQHTESIKQVQLVKERSSEAI